MVDRTFKQPWAVEFSVFAFVAALVASAAMRSSTTFGVAAIAVGGVVLALCWHRMTRRQLKVTATGVERVGLLRTTRVRWSDAFYKYVPKQEGSTAQGLLVDAAVNVAAGAVRLLRQSKRRVATTFFVSTRVGDVVPLDDYVGATAAEADIIDAIESSGAAETEPFVIESTGIRHDNRLLPFSNLERVEVADTFDVHAAGSRKAWSSVDLRAVHNLWLLVRRLVEHGVVVDLSIDAPRELLLAIETSNEMRSAMPRAELVKH